MQRATHGNDENQPRRNEESEDIFLLFVFFVSSWFIFSEESFMALCDALKR